MFWKMSEKKPGSDKTRDKTNSTNQEDTQDSIALLDPQFDSSPNG